MIKKIVIALVAVLVVLVGGAALFKDQLLERLYASLTSDMFVPAATVGYDPGLPVGAALPPVRVLHAGRTVDELRDFAGERGLLLFAVRSADW